MKSKIYFLAILLGFSSFLINNGAQASGAKKAVKCRTLDTEDNVLAYGSKCDFGWSDCLSNPCPSPDGTRVEYEDASMAD